MKEMLVLYTVVDGQVVIKGVCNLNRESMANEWANIDSHRVVQKVEVVS